MAKKTYPSGVITPELGSTNWYSDYDTNSSLLDSNITKTNSLDSKVKELETNYTNVETSLTSLSAVAKSGDYNDLLNKPESISLAEKAVADGDNNVITNTYATKKEVVTSLEPYAKKTELADVATSGSYTDLSDKPTTIAHADRATADNNGDVITVTYAKKTEIPNLDGYALSKDISKVGKTNNYKDLDNLPTIPSLDGYVTNVELSPVAKSGDYNDLSNTPEPVDLTPYATKSELTTKANDADVVHKSGTEIIVGTKTFSKPRTKFYKSLDLYHDEDYKLNTNPSVKAYQYVFFAGKSGWYSAFLENQVDTDGASYCNLSTRNTNEQSAQVQLAIDSKNVKTLKPITNNDISLGTSANKWEAVYATTFDGNLVAKQINTSDSSSLLRIFGGTAPSTGANLDLCGENEPKSGGDFVLRARNSSGYKALIGKINGSLTWDNNEILTRVNGVTLDTAQTITGEKTFSKTVHVEGITGKNSSNNLWVHAGDLNATYAMVKLRYDGTIALDCVNATTEKSSHMDIKPDGTFTWNGGNVLTAGTTIMLAKNLTGANITPGGVVDCGNGNGKLKQWYLNANGTFSLANTLPTGIWKSTSFATLAPNEGGIFIKLS